MKNKMKGVQNVTCKITLITALLFLASFACADAEDTRAKSFHLGFMYPNGVDVVGFTVEEKISNNVYSFYTFGIPSFAAIGLSYYSNFDGNGFSGTWGVGLGSIMYGSLAYQWTVGNTDYLKFGAGVTTGVAYSGAYPVFSYEHRFYK